MCKYCDEAVPLVVGKCSDYGIAIIFPNTLIAYGYDVHGAGSNGITTKINYCPKCGKRISNTRDS